MSKKPDWFKGIFPALVTPFTQDDRLDEIAYRELIRHLLPHVDGLVPSGTTGEFSYLTEAERIRTIEIALEEAGGKPVVAGTGCPSTRATVRLTQAAKDVGATAALVVAPYYLKPAFNEIYEHYQAVNKVGLPIILYNIPQCAGTHYRWWTAEGMATDLDNVVGIKDSSGDVPFLMAVLEKVKGTIGIFTGHDETLAAALAAGADGAILASANLIPDIEQEIYRAVQRRDLETAHRRQQEIQILVRLVARKGANQAVKEGLQMMGLRMSDSRLPIMPGGAFEREDREDLRTQLENLGYIGKKPVSFPVGGGLTADYAATHATPPTIGDLTLRVGEGFAGPPFQEIAHIDLLLGLKDGPVGRAMARALKEGRPGHELKVINERPRTLLVPTVTVRGTKAAQLVYEDAAAGVNLAVEHSVTQGFLPEGLLDEICLIANVFVHPAAAIRRRIKINNYKAMRGAVRKAIEGRPSVEELIREKAAARHPFRYAP
ncbi:MAG: formaldehyde-activating enzyme [Anaerolineae bacterium]|nr:MAG: formaldehyde-activating enzyme [Anaerolineae bacterium]